MMTIPDFGDPAAVPPAILSADGRYRYLLTRTIRFPNLFEPDEKVCLFVMLNPSTADASEDDPTIRRCIGYATREGCTRLWVCNLSPLRATDPKYLKMGGRDAADVRALNLDMAHAAASCADLVIVAWGANGHWQDRDRDMLERLSEFPMFCLGTTKHGLPLHPLMQPGDAALVPFDPRVRTF